MSLEKVIETDVLVIGGGIAGFFAAIKAREQGVDVILVDKGYAGKSGESPSVNTSTIFNPEWGHKLNEWVTSASAKCEYTNNPEWTEIVFKESYARWQEMCSWGIDVFKWDKSGNVFTSSALKNDGDIVILRKKEGGLYKSPHESVRFPIRKNMEIFRKQAVKAGVKFLDRIMITDLIKQDGTIVGAVGFPVDSYELYIFKAKATIISAGVAGYKPNGMSGAITGDAHAMAYRAGCEITGKEWIDTHPTRADFPAWGWSAYDRDRSKSSKEKTAMVSIYNVEGVRIGSLLSNEMSDVYEAHAGRAPIYWEVKSDFVRPEYEPMADSPKGMPRKSMDDAVGKQGKVRMVIGRNLGEARHMSEGIWPINTQCATQFPGLYAAGGSLGARTGGTNYVAQGFASTSCYVTGARAGTSAAEYAKQVKKLEIDKDEINRLKKIVYAPAERKGGFSPGWVTQVLQNTLTPYWVLYLKHGDRMRATLTQIEFMRDNLVPKLMAEDPHDLRLAHEVKSMILNTEMKLRASLYRTESRGSHYREDYPGRDDPAWLVWVKIKDENGSMKLSKEPIPQKWWPDLSIPYEKRYPIAFPGEKRR
jgi:succinate dehydrogenase/fumarate reductase flavoprotein subunit